MAAILTFCAKSLDCFEAAHAARRPQHVLSGGDRSPGAAVLLPMITSEMADIEERAVLGCCCSSHALQHKRAMRWREWLRCLEGVLLPPLRAPTIRKASHKSRQAAPELPCVRVTHYHMRVCSAVRCAGALIAVAQSRSIRYHHPH